MGKVTRLLRRRPIRALGAGLLSAQAATANAEGAGLAATPAMPFWALILLVLLIAGVGYLMTRKG